MSRKTDLFYTDGLGRPDKAEYADGPVSQEAFEAALPLPGVEVGRVERNKQIAIADSQLNHSIFLPLQPAFDPGTARQPLWHTRPAKIRQVLRALFLETRQQGLLLRQQLLEMDQRINWVVVLKIPESWNLLVCPFVLC